MYSTNTWNISRIKFMRLKVFLFIHTETQCLRRLEDRKCICALNPCVFGLKVKRSQSFENLFLMEEFMRGKFAKYHVKFESNLTIC